MSSAVALANLEIFEDEKLLAHVRANEDAFRASLRTLEDLPIVGDVRGDGYFFGVELVKDKATGELSMTKKPTFSCGGSFAGTV